MKMLITKPNIRNNKVDSFICGSIVKNVSKKPSISPDKKGAFQHPETPHNDSFVTQCRK